MGCMSGGGRPGPSSHALLTHGGADAIALGVDEAPDLGEVAVALGHILNGGGLHEQRIVSCQCPLNTLLVVFHQCRGLAAHEGPHLLEGGDLGLLIPPEGQEYRVIELPGDPAPLIPLH